MKWIKIGWNKIKLSRKQRFLLAFCGMVTIVGFGFYFWGNQASAAEYMTSKVERGNLRNTVTATGTLQAVTTVQVGSQASGTISALYADFNSIVKKGQVVAQLDPAVSKAQVDQSRANLEQARASLQQAVAGVANSRAGITDAQAKAAAAGSTAQSEQANVSSAQANLAVLKAQLDDAASFLHQQESLVQSGVIATRDLETAQIAIQASLTGHLVFATLHTNDACSSIVRLTDLGVDPVKLAGALKGVVAQRLIRRLCPVCRQVANAGVPRRLIGAIPESSMIYVSMGCKDCATGYSGRVAVTEVLVATPEIERAIAAGDSAERLVAAARSSGTRSGGSTSARPTRRSRAGPLPRSSRACAWSRASASRWRSASPARWSSCCASRSRRWPTRSGSTSAW